LSESIEHLTVAAVKPENSSGSGEAIDQEELRSF